VLGYNANGDRTSESMNGLVTNFGYDYDDRLVSLNKSGTSVSYAYDALGRQLSKTVNGAMTIYYFDGGQVVLEKQGGVTTAQYLWGNGLVRCNGEYPLTDGRVNVRLSTNSNQQVTSTNQPDAFGVGSVTSGTASACSYGGAVGYRQDGIAPAGLNSGYAFQKVGARYYDPTFGCFLTRDTELSQKPYAYCNGDPVNRMDPDGHRNKKVNGPIITFGYGFSFSLGIVHYDFSGGIAIGRGGIFGYGTAGVYNGIGFGGSFSPTIGAGYGSMNGFSGFSSGGVGVFGPHGGGGVSFNKGYGGFNFNPPVGGGGSEYGIFPAGGSSTALF